MSTTNNIAQNSHQFSQCSYQQQKSQKILNNRHQQQQQQHHDRCVCSLCQKQKQIQEFKKNKNRMHLYSIYQNDFVKMSKKSKSKGKGSNGKQGNRCQDKGQDKSVRNLLSYSELDNRNDNEIKNNKSKYLQLQSTYGADFIKKNSQILKSRPEDNLSSGNNYMPGSTTYMRSYNSTLTPRPDQPFKRLQMPVGTNTIQFSSQSVYQKAYKRQSSPKPNLPFIHREAISKPKSLGIFESTQKKSYLTINPQKNRQHQTIKLKPQGNLTNLQPFAHNYETTYKNNYPISYSLQKQANKVHGLDQLGNIYKRAPRAYMF